MGLVNDKSQEEAAGWN